MNKLLILIIFVTNLFSLEIKNGDVLILKAPKEITGELYLDKKRIFWITDPNDKNQNIAILAANYRQKNNMVAKSFVNGKTETEILKLIKGNYKSEELKVEPKKVNPPKSALIRIKKELDEANKIYAVTEKNIFLMRRLLFL